MSGWRKKSKQNHLAKSQGSRAGSLQKGRTKLVAYLKWGWCPATTSWSQNFVICRNSAWFQWPCCDQLWFGQTRGWSAACYRVLRSFEYLVQVLMVYTPKAWEAQGLVGWQVVHSASTGDFAFCRAFYFVLLWQLVFQSPRCSEEYGYLPVCGISALVQHLEQWDLAVPEALWCSDSIGSKIITYCNVAFWKPFWHRLLSSGMVVVQHNCI